MLGLIFTLLVIGVVLILVGAFVKGLIWLLVIGVVVFVGTSAIGFVKRKTLSRSGR